MILTKHEETKKGRLFHENEKLRIFVSSCSINKSTLKSQHSLRTVAPTTPLPSARPLVACYQRDARRGGVPFGRGGVCNILIANKILTPPQPLPYKGGEWLRLRSLQVGTF